jgi:proline iminopeptidase
MFDCGGMAFNEAGFPASVGTLKVRFKLHHCLGLVRPFALPMAAHYDSRTMKNLRFLIFLLMLGLGTLAGAQASKPVAHAASASNVYPVQEGFVDANGVMIYYKILGRGAPLMIVHGGPGASHDYFLPYLLPLARHNKVVFIDERGSGRSQKLEDPSGYTVENMVEDVEAVRQALGLGKISLIGHSYGGALAQAYALKYQANLTHLILGSTWSSSKALNEIFVKMKQNMSPELRERIDKLEAAGLFGHGKDYEKNRYTNDYMIAAWGEGYFPYLYQNHPDPNYDPVDNGKMAWDLYREMWGEHGEFVIDGNLKSVEYTDRLASIKVPTLVLVGDHDECDPTLSQAMHEKIAGSKIVVFPKAGHMTFVDDTGMFIQTVDDFLHASK